MKRNVNFLLFGLVLLSVVAIIAISVLYSIRYDRFKESSGLLEKDLMAKVEELNRTLAEVKAKEELLNQKERVLSSYISELNLSKERETSLGGHFIDLKNEKIYLEDKLNKTLLDRDKWKTYYDTTKKDFDVCRLDYELEKERSEERLNEILRIRNLKPGLQTNTERLKARENDAEANANAIEGSVES
ncbi:MAG: hypothetical protein FJY77_03680, partial [Candidatus Altiarchaeales archaeon]|nr:hypothetical protein [Candidatus Altiarchaeales archaeon]